MKNSLIYTAGLCASVFLASCMSVDSDVAEAPTRYWKAPKDALPEKYVSPSQIKTDEITEVEKSLSASDKLISGRKLTLEDLVDIALENNTSTRMYWFQAKVYAAQKGQVDSQYFPSISVGAQVARQKNRNTSFFPLGVGTYWATGYGPSLQMNWLLYDFGKREAMSSAAKESLRAANFDYNQSIQDVVLNVHMGYFNLYNALASVKTAEANLEDARNSYEASNARFKNEIGNKQDMLRALANAKNAEFALEQAKASVEAARANLAAYLGIEVDQTLQISEEFVLPKSKEAEKRIEELMASALKQRQSVLAAYSNLAAAKYNTESSIRDFLPKISAVGAMVWTDYTGNEFYGTPSNQYSLGAQLTWDIFEGFSKQYELISARAKERAAAQQLKETEISIVSAVWTYYYAYKSALKQLDSTSAAVDASQEAYNATKAAYDNGVSTLTDLLNAQSLLSQARSQKVSAESTLAISIAQLAHATGALTAGIAVDGEEM